MDHRVLHCEVKESGIAGLGIFTTRRLGASHELLREAAFFTRSDRATNITTPSKPEAVSKCTRKPQSSENSDRISAALSAVRIQHKYCPSSVRLAPEDTGGTVGGSGDTFFFARAYLASSKLIRQDVQDLGAFGGDESHAIMDVIRAEVSILRGLDTELQLISAEELGRAVHRYWANTFGAEGSLYKFGSRFNHSCAPNCTRATSEGGAKQVYKTIRPVALGEELTLNYLPSKLDLMGTVVRRRHLWLSRGFLCRCDRCLHPQDKLRQVVCPECAALASARQERCEDGTQPHAAIDGLDHVGREPRVPRVPHVKEGMFADWWTESGLWVCEQCGWYSDGSGSLHRKEASLSAEMFAFVMADLVPDALGVCDGGRCVTDDAQRRRQARRDAIQAMLGASIALLGSRHWVTLSCILLRLEDYSVPERDTYDQRKPKEVSIGLMSPESSRSPERVMRELNALWQWLSVALVPFNESHPPAYHLFHVVVGLARKGDCCSNSGWATGLELLSGLQSWCSVFGDDYQIKVLAIAVAECQSKG